MTVKERLHELIDELSEAAAALLEELGSDDGDACLTPEELAELASAEEEVARGDVVDGEAFLAALR
ncbi:MAG: hypothetical protein IT303_15485 [Dehalococcoidia bacterium]|nr:hypothetical protein [Dehalococcoidia bacterium]